MPDDDIVHIIHVKMKNKHNTMNSASSAKTYIKKLKILTNKSLNVIITPEIVFELKTILWLKSLESYIEFIIYDVNVKSIKR